MFRQAPKLFVWCFCVVLTAFVPGVVLFMIVVDPYWRFNLVELPGFNDEKPQVAHQVRLAKTHSVCALRPTNVVLGSSRVEMAIDPEYAAWSPYPGPTYNLAMAGAGLWEMAKTLQHAYYASGRLRLAVIGLDFFMFNAHREAVVFGTEVIDFDEERLVLTEDDSCFGSFLYDLDSFVGDKAAKASWLTVTQESQELYLHNGLRHQTRNMLYARMLRSGQHAPFVESERAYVEKIWRAGPEKRFCLSLPDGPNTLDTFRDIVTFAYDKGIDLRLFVGPQHARMLFAIKEAGLWVEYEEWKRGMVRILAEEAARRQAPTFPLWDFSGFNSVTTEAVPPVDDRATSMTWYWEGSHYKLAAGDMILDRVLGYSNVARHVPDDFGVLLTPEYIESHLASTLAGADLFERNDPQTAAEIRAEVDEVLEGELGSNCGLPWHEFTNGLEALRRGDAAAALASFDRSLAMYRAEAQQFRERGLPYREGGFLTELYSERASLLSSLGWNN